MADTAKATGFTKAQIVGSKKYSDKRDLLEALLDENKTYTSTEIKAVIDGFLNKKLK